MSAGSRSFFFCFDLFLSPFFLFLSTLLRSLQRVVLFVALGSTTTARRNLCGRLRSDPAISSIKTSTMITASNSPLRGSGTLYHLNGVLVHTMDGSELSRVRTELERRRILTTIPPHPVQADSQPPPHRYFGNALVPTHGQVHIPTSPVRVDPCRRLRCLHQQVAQQGIALLSDVSEPLLAGAGVFTGNHSHIRSDLPAAVESLRRADDQHVGQCRNRAHARMRRQPQRVRPLPGFLLHRYG